MYHSRFRGTHYEAGYKYGIRLAKNDVHLDDIHILNLTEEKRVFGGQCAEICRKVYPEIMEEMRGFTDGQRIPFDDFAAFIFGIYCFTLDNLCTCFACRDDENILFGRNSDFLTKLESVYESCYYKLEGWHAFIGNTTAMVQMEDGVNKYGLAVGLTFVYPRVIRPGLNAGLLVRYLLERCKTVPEALAALHTLPIASNQTLTMADRQGRMAVVECNSEKIVEIMPSGNKYFVATANNFNSPEMAAYRNPDIDDWRSGERCATAKAALEKADSYSLEFARDLLSGRHGFMCQYDRDTGYDTVWSSIYDLKNLRVYRAEGNPSRTEFKADTRLSFAAED